LDRKIPIGRHELRDAGHELVLDIEVVGEGGEVEVEDGGGAAHHGRRLHHRLQEGLREGAAHRRPAQGVEYKKKYKNQVQFQSFLLKQMEERFDLISGGQCQSF
jgi:hypothetical protein